MKKEYVYFIILNIEKHQYVKIGKSNCEKGVLSRFSGIQTGSPFELKLLGYLEGSEQQWHSLFEKNKTRGEWFHFKNIKYLISNLNLIVPKNILNNFYGKMYYKYKMELRELENEIHKGTKEYKTNELNENLINIKNEKYLSILYRSEILNEPLWKLQSEEEEYKKEFEEALKNIKHIERVINFIYNGHDGETWSHGIGNPLIRITEKTHSGTLDFWDNPINLGDPYIMIRDYGRGFSLISGLRIYRLFLRFMKARKFSKKWNKEEKFPNGTPFENITMQVNTESLYNISEKILEDIKKEIGILYFDKEIGEWRDKELEQKYKTIKNKINYTNEKKQAVEEYGKSLIQ
jgi:hypothetical protein